MILSHQVCHAPGAVRVLLSGELDMAVQEELHDVLHAAVAGSAGVTEVDLRHVTFLDCAVIGELVGAYLDARGRGQVLVVAQPQGFIRQVLELTRVLALLTSRPAGLTASLIGPVTADG
jgi:anti-anti-sigma factor